MAENYKSFTHLNKAMAKEMHNIYHWERNQCPRILVNYTGYTVTPVTPFTPFTPLTPVTVYTGCAAYSVYIPPDSIYSVDTVFTVYAVYNQRISVTGVPPSRTRFATSLILYIMI